MKILYVAPRMHTNQVPMLKGLLEIGHQVKFLAYYVGQIESHDVVEPTVLKPSRASQNKIQKKMNADKCLIYDDAVCKYMHPRFIDLYNEIAAFKPDVVILRNRGLNGLMVVIACKLLNIKKVIGYTQEPLLILKKKKSLSKVVKDILFPKAEYTPVEYIHLQGQDIANEQRRSHCHFVPMVYSDVAERKVYDKREIVQFIDIGKYRDYKNHFVLVNAIHLLKERNDFHVTIMGQNGTKVEDDYLKKLKEQIFEYGIEDKISFVDTVDYSLMQEIYAKHDVLILPSKHETFGMVILEAMANGLAIISSDNCGATSYSEKSGGGLVFNHKDAEELAEQMRRILDKKDSLALMGKKNIDFVNSNCSVQNYLECLNKLIEEEYGKK